MGQSGFLVGDRFDFVVNCDDLVASEEARLRKYPARISSGETVEIHGFASVDGAAGFNEELSCARALKAQAILSAELTAAGKSATLTLFKHGATPGPATERRSVVLVPRLATPPAPPPAPTCAGHVLGRNSTCGTGPDFTFHDFPAISSTLKSLAVAAFRPLPDAALEFDMQYALPLGLVTIGGPAGSAAFTHFKSGGGAPVTHGPTSLLGGLALTSPEFAAAVAAVQADVQGQLTAQAAAGPIDCLALSIPAARLPVVSWRYSTLLPLTAVIGGTHGIVVSLASFLADPVTRTYSVDLRFEICDNFGVDEADLYADSLIAFWLLQHERVGYRPFVNTIDLTRTVRGRF